VVDELANSAVWRSRPIRCSIVDTGFDGQPWDWPAGERPPFSGRFNSANRDGDSLDFLLYLQSAG
jgi:hypothetical protein